MMERKGTAVSAEDIAILLTNDAAVYRPDGAPLCLLKKGALSKQVTEAAYPGLHSLRNKFTDNRGNYSGADSQFAADLARIQSGEVLPGRKSPRSQPGHISAAGRRAKSTGPSGRRGKAHRTLNELGQVIGVASSVIGYYDRYPRIPFCRQTAFTARDTEYWHDCQPMIRAAADLFKETLPDRYAKQMEVVARTTPAFVIEGTPFTTLTVNNNVVSSIHRDAGDYKDGMGVISCIRRGQYEGCWLAFPQYGVAADLQDGDVLFFNSHDWHANTSFQNAEEGYERITIVYYFRTGMLECLSLQEELERAKEHGGHNIRLHTGR